MNQIDLRGLDLNLIRVLHVLLEERNVSRAAERLYLSQSATSHALRRLREFFDDPLLTRTARGMQPTARAEAMAPILARVLDDLASLTGAVEFVPARAESIVRMVVLPIATINVLPQLYGFLSEEAPGLRVECLQWSADSMQALERGRIDFAIGTRAQCERDGLQCEPYLTERYACVTRRGHPAAKKPLTQTVYESWPHLHIEAALPQTGPINTTLESLGVRRSVQYTTQHLLTAHRTLERSDMIATVTRTVAELFARSADVEILEPPVDVGELPVFLAWHPRYGTSPMHGWLRTQLHRFAGAGSLAEA